MKKETITTIIEGKGVRFLEDVLESEGKIKCRFNTNDKTPLLDGFFNYLNENNEIIKSFDVQIKSTNDIHKISNGSNKGKYKYNFDRDVLDSIRTKVTENPTFYFIVNPKERIVLFKYLSTDFLVKLNYINSKNKKIKYYFDDSDLLCDLTKFYSLLEAIRTKSLETNVFKTKEEIIYIQKTMNSFYGKIRDLDFIIKKIWPNFWKFGIRTGNYNVSFKNNERNFGGECSAFAIYPMEFGDVSSDIKEYAPSPDNLFTEYDFTKNKTAEEYLDDCLGRILDFYFNETYHYLHFFPDICLEELSFAFLDELVVIEKDNCSKEYYHTYNAPVINITEFELKLIPFLEVARKILRKELSFDEKNVVMMYFVKFSDDDNIFFDIDKIRKIVLYNQVLNELKIRKIEILNRPWNYMVKINKVHFPCCQAELFDEIRFKESLDVFMNKIDSYIKDIIDRFPAKLKKPFLGTYYYELILNDKPFIDYSIKMAKINNALEINIINKKISDGLLYEVSCVSTNAVDFFNGNTPVYNFSKIMIKKMISNKLGIKNNGMKINNLIMKDFLLF